MKWKDGVTYIDLENDKGVLLGYLVRIIEDSEFTINIIRRGGNDGTLTFGSFEGTLEEAKAKLILCLAEAKFKGLA